MFPFACLFLTALAGPAGHVVLPAESGLTLPVADWYVDASGASCAAANGSAAAPFCTIAAALVAAVDGDTIYIAAGTYFEHLTIDEDLRLVGTDGREVTFVDGSNSGRPITITTGAIVTIEGLTVQHGLAPDSHCSAHGGGILSSGTLTLRNSTVSNNFAANSWCLTTFDAGGGIAIEYGAGSTRIIGCIVSDNDTGGGFYSYGGGVWAYSDVLIVGSEIARNGARYGGGIHLGAGGTILNSTVSDNSFTGISANSNLLLRNSTISGNSGGLDVRGNPPGVVEVSGVTIVNSAASGITNYSGAVVRLHNSVIARNSPAFPAFGDLFGGAFVSLGHNLIGNVGTTTGFGAPGDLIGTVAAPLDPQLGPLAAHGGPTRTHAPLPGSPLIDAADPLTFDPLDQRGYARVGAPDIGAHEFGASGGAPISGCTSAPNSTGAVGRVGALGSTSVSDNTFMLSTSSLPTQAFGFFLASRTPGFAAQPGGSAGNLCLGGGIGRFVGPGQVRSTGTSGSFALAVDLQRHPTPMGLVPVAPGETWHYQAWHRDTLGGAATSNFSAGVQVTFTQ